MQISSKDNFLIKKIIKLAKDSAYRKIEGLAIISGRNLLVEAQKHGILNELLIQEDCEKKYRDIIVRHVPHKIYFSNSLVMNKINLVASNTDIIGVIRITPPNLVEGVYGEDCIILENISDPGNLGTILRLAAASNIKNVILSNKSVDVYSPKVLRSSAGIQLGLNIFTNVVVEDFILHYRGEVLATTPYNTEKTLYSMPLKNKIAWVFGNESSGISADLLAKIKHKVMIPMPGKSESLNVAMAATVCLFEMLRQREYSCEV